MKLESLAARGIRWTGLSSASIVLCDTARALVLARYLSPTDYGLMGMAGVIIGFAQIYMDAGISAAIIHRQDSTKEELSSLYWLNIFFGFLTFVLLWAFVPVVPVIFHEPRMVPLLKAMTLVFIIVPAGSQFEILLQKELSFKQLARWEIAASLSGVTVAIVLAVCHFGVWTLVFSFLANAIVKSGLLINVGLRRFRPLLHFSLKDTKGYVGFGLFQMGERTINCLSEKLDQILIGRLAGAEALGYYNFALYLTAQPISRINPILTRVAFPLFSKIQRDRSELKRGYLRVLGLLATVNAPLLIGLAAVAPWAIPAVFGAKWHGSVLLVQILSFVALLRSMGNPIGSLQLAKGRADLGFWWNVLVLSCSLPTIYAGAKIGQATGVALGLLLLQVCLTIPAYMFLVEPLIGRCAREYVGVTLRPVGVAVLMGLLVAILPAFYRDAPSRAALGIQILLGALIYISLIRMWNRGAIAEIRSTLLSR